MTPPVLSGNGHRSLRGFPNPHDNTNTKKADRIPVRPFLCIGICGAEAKRVCGIAQPYNFSDGNPAWDAYAEPSASEAYLKPKKKPLYA